MLIPKKTRKAIYSNLFKEGVMVAKKDFNLPKHPEVTEATNLQVCKSMQSLTSRGYVKELFAWRHFYWSLTDEGIMYLREYLHLPAEVVPNTLKRAAQPARVAGPGAGGDAPRREGGFGGGGDRGGDRGAYRREGAPGGRGGGFGGGGGDKKMGGAEPGFRPSFRGGFEGGRGRGRGAAPPQ